MEVRLVITATKDQDPHNKLGREYVFKDVMTIYIGRGNSNDVPLTDPGRKVSRNHARLVASNHGYILEDLVSKNSTFINNTRLESGQQKALRNGDRISVGEFTIDYFVTYSLQEGEETFFNSLVRGGDGQVSFNPFSDAVDDVFKSLRRVCDLYDHHNEKTRKDYLSKAIEKALPNYEKHETMNIFLQSIASHELNHTGGIPDLPQEPVRRKAPPRARTRKLGTSEMVLFDAVLASLHKLIRLPNQFIQEFIPEQPHPNGSTSPFLMEDFREMRKYLLSSSPETQDHAKKLELLQHDTDQAIAHHTGLIEGYKAVVREVLHLILREVDPGAVEQSLLKTKALLRVFPALRARSVLHTLKENVEHIQMTDMNMYEKRVYRPIFLQAYRAIAGLELPEDVGMEENEEVQSQRNDQDIADAGQENMDNDQTSYAPDDFKTNM